MPTDTAMQIHQSFELKQKQNPSADQVTLFKYILWDRLSGLTVPDSEIDQIATQARNLADLTFETLTREKPTMAEGRLAQSAKDAIKRYYSMNYPAGLSR